MVLTYKESCNDRKAPEGNSSKSLCTYKYHGMVFKIIKLTRRTELNRHS